VGRRQSDRRRPNAENGGIPRPLFKKSGMRSLSHNSKDQISNQQDVAQVHVIFRA
jgi:hypothetical protein